VLELAGGITLATALGMSVLVQVRVWRAVTSDGDDDEHNDFKIRTEQRRQQEIEQALEEQKVIVAKLVEARAVLRRRRTSRRCTITRCNARTLCKTMTTAAKRSASQARGRRARRTLSKRTAVVFLFRSRRRVSPRLAARGPAAASQPVANVASDHRSPQATSMRGKVALSVMHRTEHAHRSGASASRMGRYGHPASAAAG
jgi:hypothetical protein